MQQQKENLTALINITVAEHLALEEQDAAFKLALGNITSSLRQLTLMDARNASDIEKTEFNQTYPDNETVQVSPYNLEFSVALLKSKLAINMAAWAEYLR